MNTRKNNPLTNDPMYHKSGLSTGRSSGRIMVSYLRHRKNRKTDNNVKSAGRFNHTIIPEPSTDKVY